MSDTPLFIPGNHPRLVQLLRCWGKTGDTLELFHPALFHLLDVGHVAQKLLQDPASPRWRRVLSQALNAPTETLMQWLPWFVALHDIGKLSAPFQAQNRLHHKRLLNEGFDFGHVRMANTLPHTNAGQLALLDELLLSLPLTLPAYLQQALYEMIGGHHGVFTTPDAYQQYHRQQKAHEEPAIWSELRLAAAHSLQTVLLVRPPEPWPVPTNVSVAIMALTGFTILCDWLGSDTHHFLLTPELDWFSYIPLSRERAQNAIRQAGFSRPTFSTTPASFATLFPAQPPRPLQKAIDEIPARLLAYPSLAIIEAPTGEGKTEAALALAHRLAQATGSNEFYCALPTTATSNQMFGRLEQYLQENLNLPGPVKLIHGQAMLLEDDHPPAPAPDAETDTPHPSLAWFAPKKRSLLAPFGVGTIDQVELTALNVSHNALRLIGLAGKVIILDEVHAYDTYMTTIIEQMLRWLSALGCSVILLSATLPTARRQALAQAYGATLALEPEKETAYPSLWVGNQTGSCHLTPSAHQPHRSLYLHWLTATQTASGLALPDAAADDYLPHARWLLQTITDGGCACWITNTVAQAQQLYLAVRLLDPGLNCLLIHARFPLEKRQALEQKLTAQYGPRGHRPERGIVIGTQVLEQSLDLDFDVMVSDLAPIDLLLQRAGRLHRHTRPRLPRHQAPHLWLHYRPDNDGNPLVRDEDVYPPYLLHLTYAVLRPRASLTLPDDYRPLVEAVYQENSPGPGSPFLSLWHKLQQDQNKARQIAQQRLLPSPTPDRPFNHHNLPTFSEDEDRATWMVAQTRLAPESLTMIPLTLDDRYAIIPGTSERFFCDQSATRAEQLRLLRSSLRLSHPVVIRALKANESTLIPLFAQSVLLKSVRPLWFTQGQTVLVTDKKSIKLTLDDDLGLVIGKAEKL